MKLSEFKGLDPKMVQLMRSARAGRIVHALLFTGPHGTGKRSMADIFARAMLCTSQEERPCDVCPACKRVLAGVHPDVHILEPDGSSIKVDAMREFLNTIGLTSYEGGKKIAIIEHADTMNENAQNALLKTLENPPEETVFFLLADTDGALLPTVLSRCLKVRFSCLEVSECVRALTEAGIEEEKARLLSSLAQGSVGRALEIHNDEEYLEFREKVIKALCSIHSREDVLQASSVIGEAKGKEEAFFEILEHWARDLMCVQNGVTPHMVSESRRMSEVWFSGSDLLRGLVRMRTQLKANMALGRAFEQMAFELLDGKDSRYRG